MKLLFITLLIPFSAFTVTAQTKGKTTTKKRITTTIKKPMVAGIAKNYLDSASYAFGISMGEGLKERGLSTLNYDLMVKGLRDAFAANKAMLSGPVAQAAISRAFAQAGKAKYAGKIAEGNAFLQSNKNIKGVKTTSSGLQYMVIKEGNGIKPKATDTILAHYKGTLLNGKQFDSSYDRNEPLSLPLNNVIAGWTEGMQLMPTGSKYRFFIPYQLGYGERGAGQDIPPYSTLVFEIELLKVNGK